MKNQSKPHESTRFDFQSLPYCGAKTRSGSGCQSPAMKNGRCRLADGGNGALSSFSISENARTSLVLNLLTEDNLPYYHAAIEKNLPETSAFTAWNHLWTAEEGQHAIGIRSYLLTSRNCDPVELENDRMSTMINGYEPTYDDPTEIFAYTSLQELATNS